ncbi:MAG: RidA family protein [Chloroflexi bacterium]|nr:MAG: RidA family protein [Chloroflexota bacterium]TMF94854.1 MAG: RidA family protein [Chloroflexota bacterium]TMG43003.1 MAG: RidA family protein [Chloroflexota bacterium]
MVRTLRVAGLVEPISHFSDAVVAGKTLYVSGLVATNERGEIVGKGDVVEQTRQIFRNLRRILDAAGAAPSDVAKVTIFMRDVAQRPLINPVRQEFFGEHRPASTLVEVSRLVRDELLLEIEAIAQLPD